MDSLKGKTCSKILPCPMIFLTYMVLTGFIILNMLIGILAEVVDSTQKQENDARDVDKLTTAILDIAQTMDADNSHSISTDEFCKMVDNRQVIATLEGLGIDEDTFKRFGELVFAEAEEKEALKRNSSSGRVSVVVKQ